MTQATRWNGNGKYWIIPASVVGIMAVVTTVLTGEVRDVDQRLTEHKRTCAQEQQIVGNHLVDLKVTVARLENEIIHLRAQVTELSDDVKALK